ncbi:MAG: energy transducer TonB [Myxococcales bacterium]|nr:MAG: energy transducer TonB [Myxococcales bacterium]
MLSIRCAAGLCLAVWLCCVRAAAQANDLLPPVAESSTDVAYPEGAEGDSSVELELVISKEGAVVSASVVQGEEPFAAAARSAALSWRFAPAQREGIPVAARIRARVAFHRELEAESSSPEAPVAELPGARPPTDPAAAAEPPLEITVLGAVQDIGRTTMSQSEVRQLPGAFGDAFRAIESLPGVTPLVSGVPFFFVRGAPPNNSAFYVDGVRVPQLFHLGIGQSVIHPGLIERVDLFSSVAKVRYGGTTGAVLAGEVREPASTWRGEANVRLVDAGALLEAPFANGRGSALVAGRYGYPGPVLSAFTDDLKLGYWDYQARASFRVGSDDTIGLFAFGSHDYLATRSPSGDPEASKELQEQLVSDFHRLDLRYDHTLPEGRLRLAVTGGYDSLGAQPTYMTNRSLGARLELEQALTPELRFRGGAEARVDDYGIRVTREGPREPSVPQSANPPPANLSAGLFADFVWRVTNNVELVPGARFDVYGSARRNEPPRSGHARTAVPAVDPRLAARVRVGKRVVWLAALGMAHQYPSLRLGDIPGPLASVPGFPFDARKLQTAAQASQGVEVALPADLTFTATAFYSRFWNLTDLSASCFQYQLGDEPEPNPSTPPPPYVCPNNAPVPGSAYGLELLLRRALTKRVSGWLSYTLSRATRRAHFLTRTGEDAEATVVSEFDRTHVLNAVISLDLGRRWRFGSRLLFYTGAPYSQLDGSLPVPPYNAYRQPAFYRLDVRLEKRWALGSSGSIAFVLEGQNVTLRKEVSSLGLDCEGGPSRDGQTTVCQPSKVGPLTIPSVGIEAFF